MTQPTTSQSKSFNYRLLCSLLLIASQQVIPTEAFLGTDRNLANPHHRNPELSSSSALTTQYSTVPSSSYNYDEMDFFFPMPSEEYAMEPLQLMASTTTSEDDDDAVVTKQDQQRGFFSKFLSFSQGHAKREASKNQHQYQRQEKNNDNDGAIHCYIINYDDMINSDAAPEVYCTSNKDELAWWYGLDIDDLVNVNEMPSIHLDYSECVEGASHRGTPEWECNFILDDDDDDDDDDDIEMDWSDFDV